MSDVAAWVVTLGGFTVGEFDNEEDAVNMAAGWNAAYPHEPWFKVRGLFADPVPAGTETNP